MKKLLALLVAICACNVAYAQNISLDLKDAPIRSTLEMVFKQAGVKNYVIDNNVAGFVTCTLTDQPFENSLKIVMRAATYPLTYTKENDVYIVKVRAISENKTLPVPDILNESPKSNSFEKIHLNYIDPFDLMSVLGNILFVNQFQRFQGGMNNSFGGGFGNGSTGGMGSGNNSMGGGLSGGLGGNAFGGMNGGVGGFGGGRNF